MQLVTLDQETAWGHLLTLQLVTLDQETAWGHLLTLSSLRQGRGAKPTRFLDQWGCHPVPSGL
jgi:hypothetical protein